jgi:hypothetical protein
MENPDVSLSIAVRDAAGKARAQAEGKNSAVLLFAADYAPGDSITVTSSRWPLALRIGFDEALPAALVWLTSSALEFPVPVGEPRLAYPPESFGVGEKKLSVSAVDGAAWDAYRNLSENPLDRRGDTTYYPHCTATVETRDESVFAARNTIDGVIEPSCHGAWPYQSWGDAEDPTAEIKIEFGRVVSVDKARINLRADFPHDNYWKQAYLAFSDGSGIPLNLKKTGESQEFVFPKRDISWVKLTKLVKSDEPSPFPALTQWAIFGATQKA